VELRQRQGERPLRDQGRAVQPRLARVPVLDCDRQGVDPRRVRDHDPQEIGPVRLGERLAGLGGLFDSPHSSFHSTFIFGLGLICMADTWSRRRSILSKSFPFVS